MNHSAYKVLASGEDPDAMFDDDDDEEMTEGQLTEAIADAVAVVDNGDQEDVELQSKAYEHLKAMVTAYGRQNVVEEDDEDEEVGKSVTFQYNSIRAQRLGGVHSFTTSKTYNPVILNAVVHKDYNVIPYGYNGPNT